MSLALPPGIVPIPPAPPAPLGDRDPAVRAARIRTEADAWAATVGAFVRALWREYGPWMRWRDGLALALFPATRTVEVTLDPGPGGLPALTTRVGYGRPTWAASQIVGKRVKVMLDTDPEGAGAMWIDVVLTP